MEEPKVRYSDTELLEFKELVEKKMAVAREELTFTQGQIAEMSDTGANQQNGDMYDDSSAHTDLEFKQRMAARQVKFIDDLQKALYRIQNKTYGVCIVTGNLIPKERLRAVPHATKSVDGKMIAQKNQPQIGGSTVSDTQDIDPFGTEDKRPAGKAVGDQVRMSSNIRPSKTRSEEWEVDNETMEDAGYRTTPSDEDEH
jgi:RNA polymerase-binding protein DksA